MTEETPQHEDRGRSGDEVSDAAGNEPGAGDGWDDIVLDEDFVRAAGASEPSARARMLTERWRRDEPEPQPWRSEEPPAGWFFSKARRRWWRRR
ncbi:SGM_3592 family protein [Streptomyces sp. NPDC002309]